MICSTCKKQCYRIKVNYGFETCENCGSFSITGGAVNIHKILIRQRSRHDMLKHEGDTINPWAYDKHSKQVKPNEDWVKRNADSADVYYNESDLDHLPGLKKKVTKLKEDKVKHEAKLDKMVQFGQGDVVTKQKEIIGKTEGRKL